MYFFATWSAVMSAGKAPSNTECSPAGPGAGIETPGGQDTPMFPPDAVRAAAMRAREPGTTLLNGAVGDRDVVTGRGRSMRLARAYPPFWTAGDSSAITR
jgi:hypothetical protein